ncbi:MAG: hypothetical protein KDC57_22295 [Saprospiraceae bacterium]|nr:hypothetical protein [Saprospiraceae bacterium]
MIRLAFYLTLIFPLLPAYSQLNTSPPLSTYVWDFDAVPAEYAQQAAWLTEDFEDELLNHKELYRVLDRRDLAIVKEHEKANEMVQKEGQAYTVSMKEGLQSAQAEAFFRGTLLYDDASGEFRIKVTMNALSGSSEKMRQAEVSLRKARIDDNQSRKEAAERLFNQLHAEEKKAIRDQLSTQMDQYLFAAQELNSQISGMDNWLLLKDQMKKNAEAANSLNGHLQEFSEKITSYNAIIEDLKNNRSGYQTSFCLYWQGQECQNVERLLEDVIRFHDRIFLDDSNDLIELTNHYLQASKSKEASEWKEKLDALRKEIVSDMMRDLPDVQYSIRQFKDQTLQALRD